MRVLLTMNGSRGDDEAMALAVKRGALDAAAEECDAPVATGVMPTGGWR
jgi:hypothetical protein